VQRITTPAAATAIATDRAPHVIPATHQTSARSAANEDASTDDGLWMFMQGGYAKVRACSHTARTGSHS
jgi:hypothetical protein